MRRDVIELVHAIGRKLGDGLDELTLTTNGTQLEKFAEDLAAGRHAGGSTSRSTRWTASCSNGFPAATGSVRCCAALPRRRRAGLKVKLNTVALKGLNEEEIPFLVEWAHAHGHEITLIEVMPLGEVEGERVDHYLPLTAVRDVLDARWTLAPSAHTQRRPGALFRHCRDRRADRLDHSADQQFLRRLQPHPRDRHRPALRLPRRLRAGRSARRAALRRLPTRCSPKRSTKRCGSSPRTHHFRIEQGSGSGAAAAHVAHRRLSDGGQAGLPRQARRPRRCARTGRRGAARLGDLLVEALERRTRRARSQATRCALAVNGTVLADKADAARR